MAMNTIESHGDGDTLVIRGRSHTLKAMPVGGAQWVGMFAIDSPNDSALLMPYDALAVREWANLMLTRHLDIDRPEHDDAECLRAHEEKFELDLCPACYTKYFLAR